MAVTQNTYTGDGSTVLYNFTFPYLTQTDVKVKLDGATQATTEYSFANATTVQMDSAPANGVKVIIYRDTDNDNKKATFYPGSAIKAEDLNNNIDQILYVAQEVDNNAMSSLGDTPMQGDMEFGQGMGIVFEGATTDNFETRLAVADPTADRTITLPNVTGTVITTGDTGTVTSTMITDGTIVNADINASAAIAQSKLNIANATTSAAGYQSAADKTKLDGIETGATADQTNAEIRAAVEAATDSNVFTDADHTKLNNIETAATADQTAAEIRTLVGDASNSNVFTDADNAKLAGIETAATADQTASEIKALIASSPLDASHLAADSVTTSELADAELTTLAGMQSGTASILASSTALTSTTTELNQLDGKTLGETTLTTNSDTAIPTSKAVNDRIVTVTNALGGFVAIADKDSFPTSHPDPGENAGTVVSISNAVGISVNSSGVGSLATRAGGSDAVIINGFPSALRGGATVGSATNADPYVLPANVGLQVQTTSTAHTYDYHKYLINEEDANKLSGDIQDFQERYRVASSAPTSNNDDGDLYFDTNLKKMKVYNGATSQWDDVASSSSSYIVTLSESFDGSRTDFTMSTAATDAQSTIVSINGVVQKPNAGTSTPAEGFAINGTTLKLSNAPATGSTYFVVVLGDTVSIGTPSDNTVSTDKIQNLAVTGDKIATNLDLADNKKIRFGTGNDLEIYHDGTHSIVNDAGTGQLRLTGSHVVLRAAPYGEVYQVCTENGAVELYYDGSKKAETASWGLNVLGNCGVGDSSKFQCGDSQDLQIYHDGTNSWINNSTGALYLKAAASNAVLVLDNNDDTIFRAVDDGATELYYDNVKKLETNSEGVQIHGKTYAEGSIDMPDDAKLLIGNGDDLEIYHASNISTIKDNYGDLRIMGDTIRIQRNAGGENFLYATEGGKTSLYYDGSEKLETHTTGVVVHGNISPDNLYLGDNEKAYFGDGSDLQIWHDGSHTRLNNATGNFNVQTGAFVVTNAANTENIIIGTANGAVELYYDASKKFNTDSGGAQVFGVLRFDDGSSTDNHLNFGNSADLKIFHSSANSHIYHNGTGNFFIEAVDANITLRAGDGGSSTHDSIVCTNNAGVELYYDTTKRFSTTSNGALITGRGQIGGNDGGTFIADIQNDGNDANRYGLQLRCGADDGSGTNYAVAILTGNGTTQGYITFSGGTVTYGAFTAHHPCIVPDSENPSDSSNAYPYGTLLETISIEYTKQDGSDTERGIRYKVQKTQSANSRKVLGAYGSSMNGGPDNQTNEHQALVLGDGHILVNNAGGNIEVGDGICSSATAGIGQKATANPSMIIGIAQEAVTFTGSETKLVAVQYGLQQFIPWT